MHARTAGMFLEDAKTLDVTDTDSLGAKLLYRLHVLIDEVFPWRFLNPFRGYMIWDPKVRESARCAKEVAKMAQGFIDRCVCLCLLLMYANLLEQCCNHRYVRMRRAHARTHIFTHTNTLTVSL